MKHKYLHDDMTPDLLMICIDAYIKTIETERHINKFLKNKKIRISNFPSHISENIVKFAIKKKYGIFASWDITPGDIIINSDNQYLNIEVKGSINLSNGPCSFGHSEKWDIIYFLDGVDIIDKKFKIYEIKLSNDSPLWKLIKINKTQTFYDQCLQKRRPRIRFEEIKTQLGDLCQLFFDGHISELF